ncbi:MAG: UDP-glucose 4-epimerase GalE [Candidatus Doudnabacteria bacterium RIFCSPHIGHO2_01_FULL_45_18]|uniref:UDP-glucose 4-epimerase n=1 Tax=Candidatus Doudnabacteria bacterium RIFCSPHIGHO2_01_FULL_45_18 TaxID=1817823 RepID=A0A1F5NR54_9BACT|nr:MAG: UDP-glucose 4-epimerase GalE [Candidatus Doudnabacteria bacterium RIFCSPHIGHO2_01_FULL_45_18]
MANGGKILVTGGAGYIGSHTVKLLQSLGLDVIVLDDLSTGRSDRVSCPLIVGSLSDRKLLERIFHEHAIDAVIHFAGSIIVEESVQFPDKYFENNVSNGLNLLDIMVENNVKKIIFSSSAAVYGEPHYVPVDEEHPKKPVNPYGETKWVFEKILRWYAQGHGLSSVSLRYFNAAGASLDASLGEDAPVVTHLISKVLRVAARQEPVVKIFGNDYKTPDGTCLRDYIHVEDLALAHHLALDKLKADSGVFYYNVGTGQGRSVAEVVNTCVEITEKMIPIEYAPRRPGDPAVLVADPTKIKTELGFVTKYSDLETIIRTAWVWHKKLVRH